jgi:hypothetical protein
MVEVGGSILSPSNFLPTFANFSPTHAGYVYCNRWLFSLRKELDFDWHRSWRAETINLLGVARSLQKFWNSGMRPLVIRITLYGCCIPRIGQTGTSRNKSGAD